MSTRTTRCGEHGQRRRGNVGDAVGGTYGTLQLNADGSYTTRWTTARPPCRRWPRARPRPTHSTTPAPTATAAVRGATLTISVTGTDDAPVAGRRRQRSDGGSATQSGVRQRAGQRQRRRRRRRVDGEHGQRQRRERRSDRRDLRDAAAERGWHLHATRSTTARPRCRRWRKARRQPTSFSLYRLRRPWRQRRDAHHHSDRHQRSAGGRSRRQHGHGGCAIEPGVRQRARQRFRCRCHGPADGERGHRRRCQCRGAGSPAPTGRWPADDADGSYSYTLDNSKDRQCRRWPQGETATDSFSYTVSDGHGGSATATLTDHR